MVRLRLYSASIIPRQIASTRDIEQEGDPQRQFTEPPHTNRGSYFDYLRHYPRDAGFTRDEKARALPPLCYLPERLLARNAFLRFMALARYESALAPRDANH